MPLRAPPPALALLLAVVACGGAAPADTGAAKGDDTGAFGSATGDLGEAETGTAPAPTDDDDPAEDTGSGGGDGAPGDRGDGGDSDADLPEDDAESAEAAGGLWPDNPVIADENGDGRWQPGETAVLTVTLRNHSAAATELPGLVLTVEGTGVLVPESEAWVWSLEPGASAELSFWMVADPAIDAPHEVELRLSVSSQGCGPARHPCPDPNPLSVWARIAP